jgi:alanine racemase
MPDTDFQGEARLIIDPDALATNLRTMRRHLAAEVKLCAVIKANAYGHDSKRVASAICDIEKADPFLKVDRFAVSTFDEAAELGEFGKPIMLLRPVENGFLGRQRELIEEAIRRGWTMTIRSPEAADEIAQFARHLQKRAQVQIMIDTGMVRCGVAIHDFADLLERTLHHASLRLNAVSTHFASADHPGDPQTAHQVRQFSRTVNDHPILESVMKHTCNSGGIFFAPRGHFDLVRAGISLYGVDPTGTPSTDRALAPIGQLIAPLIAIHDIDAGQSVGYGQTWRATGAARIGVVAIGYADGYPRQASNRAMVKINDQFCGVVGRVSMDMLTIDLSSVPDAQIGDDVTLIDPNPLSPASIYPLCTIADTIAYEIFTGIGVRVKRVLKEPPEA